MTDITLTVAFGLAAFGVSLAASGRVVNEIARAACYSAITLMGFNQLGVTVSAPITSNSADMLNIATVAWLIVALGACCVRGLVRPLLNSSRT